MFRRSRRLICGVISFYLLALLSYFVFKNSFGLAPLPKTEKWVQGLNAIFRSEDRIPFKVQKLIEINRCLIADPKLQKNELSNGEALNNDRLICAPTQINRTFDINFNVERSFKFELVSKKEVFNGQHQQTKYHAVQSNEGIPKNLHFIWNNDLIPDPFVNNLRKFRELHPDWKIYFWTLPRGREFIQKYEPHILSTFDRYAHNVSRADSLRYVVLYHFGGAYFDLDCEPRIPLDDLLTTGDCLVGPEPIENAVFTLGMRSLLSTGAFLCKAKHAFFRHLIDSLPTKTLVKDIMTAAGPVYFTNHFNSYLMSELNKNTSFEIHTLVDIKVLRHDFFEFAPHFSNYMWECESIIENVNSYMSECHPHKTNQQRCSDLRPSDNQTDINIFDACLEWVLHGGTDRTTDSARYVNHVHYGTYNRKYMFKMKSVNISQIIRGVTEYKVSLPLP